MSLNTPYYKELRSEIQRCGGLFNAHLHLCRAYTLAETERLMGRGRNDGISHIGLPAKHAIIPMVHASDLYQPAALKVRVNACLDDIQQAGTTRAATLVDVTVDRVRLTALQTFLEIKRERKAAMELEVGAYSPLGFKDSEPERWSLLVEGAQLADFIGALPERDDRSRYPDHIGYYENCKRFLELGQRLGKPLHLHADQKNHPSERGTEVLIDAMDEMGIGPAQGEPAVWVIHVISPSTYDEARFRALLERMREKNIGVICCPSAALSMRQLRPLMTPTFNSIARVLEMLAAGLRVTIGSDNICDLASPSGTPDLMDEIFVLSNALRFYDIRILAKIAAGAALDPGDIQRLNEHLRLDEIEVANSITLQDYW